MISENSGTQMTPYLNETGSPGKRMGQLGPLARIAVEASLDRRLLCTLRDEKVGTKCIEVEG